MKIINETDKAIEILNKYQFIFDKGTEYCSLLDALESLKEYKSTRLEPQDVKDLYSLRSNPIKFITDKNELYKELNNKYHTLLEMYDKLQNESIKLPCKVGKEVYQIVGDEIETLLVASYHLNGLRAIATFVKKDGLKFDDCFEYDEYFLTKEEAEKELERLNKLEVEPRYLLEKDSVCYGCQHYEPDEENNCTSPRLCINGNVNNYREDEK